MTDSKPATKTPTKTRKPQKITIPRFANALDEIVAATDLKRESTIQDLFDELETLFFKEARGQ